MVMPSGYQHLTLILASWLCSLCISQFIHWNKPDIKLDINLMLIYKMVSGVKKHTLDKIYSILVKQMDIKSDLERLLFELSKRPAFSCTVRYFVNGLLDCQCGNNIFCQHFELKQDDNNSETFSQWNFHLDMTVI